MKLQRRLSRKYKNKNYYKYLINISEKDIKKATLKEGDELKVSAEKNKIIFEKAKNI